MSENHHYDAVGDRTVVGMLEALASRNGRATALIVESSAGAVTTLTFGELADRSARVASGLSALGVGRGDRVLVQLPNRIEIVVAWISIMRLGAIFVPSNTMNTSREIAHIVRLADVNLAICQTDAVDAIRDADPRFGAKRLVVCGPELEGYTSFDVLAMTRPESGAVFDTGRSDDVVELVFTSGTTSAPKAAMITNANCRYSGLQKAAAMELRADDQLLSALPFFHVNAQSAFLAAMTVGATFVLLENYSARRFFEQLHRHSATVTSFVSTQVRTLLRQPDEASHRGHSVERAWFALDLTEAERDEFYDRFNIRLYNGYGLTEAFTSVCQSPLRGDAHWPAVGLPLLGREVRIVGADGRPVGLGEAGEIVVRGTPGRSVMKGYWNDESATRDALRDGWLHTGDVGRFDEHRFLHFVGRKTDLIKRAGENIAAAEVEAVLGEHPDIAEIAVIGVPDPIRDEAVMAFVVLVDGSTTGPSELEHWLTTRLAAFKIPTVWSIVASLPRTSVGKIHKAALRDQNNGVPV